MPRPRVPLTFGAGLDRATGAGVRDARTLYDAQNVIAREAGLALRAGLGGSGLPVLDWGTDIIAHESVEATRDVLQVVYDRPTRVLRLYRVNPAGPTRQLVHTWGTLNVDARFPVVTMAEQDGIVYVAHAEPALALRLATIRWAPGALDTDPGTVVTAQADLDGDGTPGDLKFYAVSAYRNYIIGCGWGTEASGASDRPDIVRFSKPDDPTAWPPELYFICGSQRARIEAAVPCKGGLVCRSRTTGYTIYGLEPSSFGMELTDSNAGIVSPRAWVVVDGVGYVWSTSGPRILEDPMAPSRDVAIPLDLMQPPPPTWPLPGPEREAFAVYEPEQRVIYWAWPDLLAADRTRTLTYLLSLRSGSPRFTAGTLERRVAAAGRYLSGKVPVPPGTGYAASTTLTDEGWGNATNGRTLRVTWTNTSFTGSESAEVWLKRAGGAWTLATTVPVSATTQSHDLTGHEALESYDVAVRLRTIAGGFTAGYTQESPEDWDAATVAGAKATVTTGAAAPTISTTTWYRDSATTTAIAVSGTAVDRRLTVVLERWTGSAWVTAATGSNPAGTWNLTYTLTTEAIGDSVTFRARLERGAAVSANSGSATASTGVTLTPPPIVAFFAGGPGNPRRVEVWFERTRPVVQIEDTVSGATALVYGVGGLGFFDLVTTSTGTGPVTVRLRAGVEAYGVIDWGPWGSTQTVTYNPDYPDLPPPLPELDFFPPRGNVPLSPNLPRQWTPSTLSGPDLEAYVVTVGTFGDNLQLWGPYTPAMNETVQAIGVSGTYGVLYAFHHDTGTRRRGPLQLIY